MRKWEKMNFPKRQLRDLEKTKALILESAEQEFAEFGMSGARVDRIAKRAGVNKAMIYYIFTSKEELYLKALEKLFEEKTRGIDPPPQNATLAELAGNYFDAFARNPNIVRMVLHDVASGAHALRKLKERRPDLFAPFSMVSALLSSWKDKGVIADIDSDKAVLAGISLIVFLLGFLPHVDLIHEQGTPQHASLANTESWKEFLSNIFLKVLIK